MAFTNRRSSTNESPEREREREREREQEQDQQAIQRASTAMIQNQTQQHAQTRRKATGTRVWMVISESGESHLEEVEKHVIMRRTGLHARDLRVLDPVLSYPSSILGRERAIVVNLEHIKAIITAEEVLMVHSASPLLLQFIQDLHHRIENPQSHHAPCQEQERNDEDRDREDEFENKEGSPPSLRHRLSSQGADGSAEEMLNIPQKDESKKRSWTNVPVGGCPKVLPFEFRALEACLESTCRCLESETKTLEDEAYPALDELTSKISTLNLERVRQIKSRLVAISGRVQKVRDELENLLDDDNDMAEMHLTEKLFARSVDTTSIKEEAEKDASDVKPKRFEESAQEEYDNSEIYNGFNPSIVELEMLLEAYFAQIDGISQKLSDMNDYVDDTEDCINIMLDDKQNQLLQMGVMLSVANMIVNAGIVVVGLFGMNIHITLFDDKPIKFWETVIGTVGGCAVMYLIAVGWGKKRNLLAV